MLDHESERIIEGRDNLLRALELAIAFLDDHDEKRWSEWLDKDRVRVQRGHASGVARVLQCFGGANCLCDLVLHPENGHRLLAGEVTRVNAELKIVLKTLHDAAIALDAILIESTYSNGLYDMHSASIVRD